jgi:hypothetical protein
MARVYRRMSSGAAKHARTLVVLPVASVGHHRRHYVSDELPGRACREYDAVRAIRTPGDPEEARQIVSHELAEGVADIFSSSKECVGKNGLD